MRMILLVLIILGSLSSVVADQNTSLDISENLVLEEGFHDGIWILQGQEQGDIVIQRGDLGNFTEKRITGLTGDIETGPIRLIGDIVYSGYIIHDGNYSLYSYKWDVELDVELIIEAPYPIELFDIILLGTDIVYFLNVDLGYQIQSMMFYNHAFVKLQDLRIDELLYIGDGILGVLGDVTQTSIIKISDQKVITKMYKGSGFVIEQIFYNNVLQTFEAVGSGYRIRDWRTSEISLIPIEEYVIDIVGNLTVRMDFHSNDVHYLLAEHRVNVLGARTEDNYVDIRFSLLEFNSSSLIDYEILVRDRDVIFAGYKNDTISLLTYDVSINMYLVEEFSLENDSNFSFQIVGVIILTILWILRKDLVRLIRK